MPIDLAETTNSVDKVLLAAATRDVIVGGVWWRCSWVVVAGRLLRWRVVDTVRYGLARNTVAIVSGYAFRSHMLPPHATERSCGIRSGDPAV